MLHIGGNIGCKPIGGMAEGRREEMFNLSSYNPYPALVQETCPFENNFKPTMIAGGEKS